MANGNPENGDGFAQLAHELDAALDVADLTKAERIVFQEIKRQCFGVVKAKAAWIDTRALASRYGYKRQFTAKGLSDLIRSNIVKEVSQDAYRWNKYYRTWTFADGSVSKDNNGSRFTKSELDEIENSPKLAKGQLIQSGVGNTRQRTRKSATNELPNGNQRVADLQPTSCKSATNELPNGNQRVADLQPTSCSALNRNACGIQIETNTELKKSETTTTIPASLPKAKGEDETPQDRRDGLVMLADSMTDGKHTIRESPTLVVAKIDHFIATFGIEPVEKAFRQAMVKEGTGSIWPYILKCLETWKAEEDARKPKPRPMPQEPPEPRRILISQKVTSYRGPAPRYGT